jgi:hypothetical protein
MWLPTKRRLIPVAKITKCTRITGKKELIAADTAIRSLKISKISSRIGLTTYQLIL